MSISFKYKDAEVKMATLHKNKGTHDVITCFASLLYIQGYLVGGRKRREKREGDQLCEFYKEIFSVYEFFYEI